MYIYIYISSVYKCQLFQQIPVNLEALVKTVSLNATVQRAAPVLRESAAMAAQTNGKDTNARSVR